MDGEVTIKIDYEKYETDAKWDGLKGYITNTKHHPTALLRNYAELWKIEKAFRISKTDLRVRPIYHRLQDRIESHLWYLVWSIQSIQRVRKAIVSQKVKNNCISSY